MAIDAPRSPYETAWQQWNYGGRMRGEPMPRIEDYPETFEQNQRPAPMYQSPMTPQRLPRAPEPRFPMDERLPDGSDPRGGYGSFPQRQAPAPAPPPVYGGPGGGYQGGYMGPGTIPTPIPELSSTNTGAAYGGDLDPYGSGGSGQYGSFPQRPQRTPEPRVPMDERRPDGSDPRGGYAGGNLPYGGDLNTGQYSGYGSFPKPLNTGMPKPGGMMNPMTLGQLNRRRPY